MECSQSLGREVLMTEPKAGFEPGCGYGFERSCSALLDMWVMSSDGYISQLSVVLFPFWLQSWI